MATDAVPASTARSRARSALTRLALAPLDDDSFRFEAAAVLRQAIGFDWWCWPMIDPGARLPTRYVGVGAPPDQDPRLFARLLPEDWDGEPHRAESGPPSAVTIISEQTAGDMRRDLVWREILGPAGTGDSMGVLLAADGAAWARLQVGRDSSGSWFSDDDAGFLAGVAPLLGTRLRDGLRAPRDGNDPGPEPGTIVVDRDLSLVAATDHAWDWISRLGMAPVNDSEPLPGFIFAVAARAAAETGHPGRSRHPARVRLRTADGRWAVVRVAPLTHGPQAAQGYYAITLEQARSEDLAPLLMRAWSLTPREREVARLVIDGLSSDDIARTLFISPHTVRDHLKVIFGKTGVSRRRDLVAALAGQAPAGTERDGQRG